MFRKRRNRTPFGVSTPSGAGNPDGRAAESSPAHAPPPTPPRMDPFVAGSTTDQLSEETTRRRGTEDPNGSIESALPARSGYPSPAFRNRQLKMARPRRVPEVLERVDAGRWLI